MSYSSGLMAAQVVGFFVLPVLTRLYSQEQFGNYSLTVQLSVLVSIFITFRQEQTIILENNQAIIDGHIQKKSKLLKKILFLGVIIILFGGFLAKHIQTGAVLVSASLLILVGYFSSSLTYLEKYSRIGNSELVNKVVFSFFAVFSANFFHFYNLILAYVLGLTSKFFYLKRFFGERVKPISSASTKLSKRAGLSVAISHLFLSMTTIIPMLTVNNIYSPKELGLYSLAISVIFLPSAILSVSIGGIYIEKLTKDKQNFSEIFIRFLAIIIPLSILIFVPFAFFSVEIFTLVFGKDWANAGQFSSILALAAGVGFITSCFDRTCLVMENNLHGPIWHFARVLWVAGVSSYAVQKSLSITTYLEVMVFGWIALYLIDLVLQVSYGRQIRLHS